MFMRTYIFFLPHTLRNYKEASSILCILPCCNTLLSTTIMLLNEAPLILSLRKLPLNITVTFWTVNQDYQHCFHRQSIKSSTFCDCEPTKFSWQYAQVHLPMKENYYDFVYCMHTEFIHGLWSGMSEKYKADYQWDWVSLCWNTHWATIKLMLAWQFQIFKLYKICTGHYTNHGIS